MRNTRAYAILNNGYPAEPTITKRLLTYFVNYLTAFSSNIRSRVLAPLVRKISFSSGIQWTYKEYTQFVCLPSFLS